MLTVVTERGSLNEKLQAATEQHSLCIEDVIAEKRGLSAHKRLSLYTSGYVLRLLECMRADFPSLRNFVGDSVFDAFAQAYIISKPPVSHSMSQVTLLDNIDMTKFVSRYVIHGGADAHELPICRSCSRERRAL